MNAQSFQEQFTTDVIAHSDGTEKRVKMLEEKVRKLMNVVIAMGGGKVILCYEGCNRAIDILYLINNDDVHICEHCNRYVCDSCIAMHKTMH